MLQSLHAVDRLLEHGASFDTIIERVAVLDGNGSTGSGKTSLSGRQAGPY
ncbi:hypothetical protein [Streptomyces sp. NPDC005181]